MKGKTLPAHTKEMLVHGLSDWYNAHKTIQQPAFSGDAFAGPAVADMLPPLPIYINPGRSTINFVAGSAEWVIVRITILR